MTNEDLLSEINKFLADTGMAATYFGQLACNNWRLVDRLRDGKSVTLDTVQKVRSFIDERKETVQ